METLEMERHCRHSNSVFVPACRDAVLLQERVLANLLTAETLYCSTAGTKPRPGLAGAERRRLVTEWMLEVCQVRSGGHSTRAANEGLRRFRNQEENPYIGLLLKHLLVFSH